MAVQEMSLVRPNGLFLDVATTGNISPAEDYMYREVTRRLKANAEKHVKVCDLGGAGSSLVRLYHRLGADAQRVELLAINQQGWEQELAGDLHAMVSVHHDFINFAEFEPGDEQWDRIGALTKGADFIHEAFGPFFIGNTRGDALSPVRDMMSVASSDAILMTPSLAPYMVGRDSLLKAMTTIPVGPINYYIWQRNDNRVPAALVRSRS